MDDITNDPGFINWLFSDSGLMAIGFYLVLLGALLYHSRKG